MKRIKTLIFQGSGRLPGYEDEEDLIKLGHVGQLFIDELDQTIYAFRPTNAIAAAFGSLLSAHLKANHAVPGRLYDDRRVFYRAYKLSLDRDPSIFVEEDEDRLIIYEVMHNFDEEIYQQIRSAVLEWYNQAESTVQYKLPPPTDSADNCATAFRRVGIPSFEEIHRGQLARYIHLLKTDKNLRAKRWQPEGQIDND
jgi:hypothetical protein